jgi:hypothetical protein
VGFDVTGGGVGELLPPPPHAGANAITATNISERVERRRAGNPTITTEKNAKIPIASQRVKGARAGEAFAAVVAAVVVTVIVEVVVAGEPEAVTVED